MFFGLNWLIDILRSCHQVVDGLLPNSTFISAQSALHIFSFWYIFLGVTTFQVELLSNCSKLVLLAFFVTRWMVQPKLPYLRHRKLWSMHCASVNHCNAPLCLQFEFGLNCGALWGDRIKVIEVFCQVICRTVNWGWWVASSGIQHE